jgi:hypothetical protein
MRLFTRLPGEPQIDPHHIYVGCGVYLRRWEKRNDSLRCLARISKLSGIEGIGIEETHDKGLIGG